MLESQEALGDAFTQVKASLVEPVFEEGLPPRSPGVNSRLKEALDVLASLPEDALQEVVLLSRQMREQRRLRQRLEVRLRGLMAGRTPAS